jgi:hypothetical protein
MPHDRRLVWTVRLVLYPAVLALLAFAWHQRRADAAVKTRSETVTLRGISSQRLAVTASVTSGWLESYRTTVRLTCAGGRPELARLSAYDWQNVDRGQLRISGHRISATRTGERFTWKGGLVGTATARIDARLDGSSLRGVLSLDMVVHQDTGPVPCHTGPVGIVLRK